MQVQEQHGRPDNDQLTTDAADLKMTEEALAEDTAAFEDITQDCLVCQTKVADFEVYTNKSLSEELEALVKAKIVISEKTDDAEYRDNRSVLPSHGGLVRELIKSENSIELAQLASRIDSAMHDEISNDDDPFAKVKGLISDMITRSEERASADDTHNATHSAFEAKHIFNSMHSEIEMMRYMTMSQHKDLYLTISMISLELCSWLEVMNIPFDVASNTISYREMLNFLEAYLSCTGFDACSLQPTNGAVGEYAGLLVIRKFQESIGQDLGMKSAHGTNPDSAVTSHIDMKVKGRQSQGMPPEELRRIRQETEDVKENKLKDLIIVHCYQFDNEMVAVKSCKSPDYSGLNGCQSIVKETEYGDAQVDKADENTQNLETYDAMRKTTESEREAKGQTREQVNKYYLTMRSFLPQIRRLRPKC